MAERKQSFLMNNARALIALLAILGVFGLAAVNLAVNHTADVPSWAIALSTSVTAFYYGARANGNSHGGGGGE